MRENTAKRKNLRQNLPRFWRRPIEEFTTSTNRKTDDQDCAFRKAVNEIFVYHVYETRDGQILPVSVCPVKVHRPDCIFVCLQVKQRLHREFSASVEPILQNWPSFQA